MSKQKDIFLLLGSKKDIKRAGCMHFAKQEV